MYNLIMYNLSNSNNDKYNYSTFNNQKNDSLDCQFTIYFPNLKYILKKLCCF